MNDQTIQSINQWAASGSSAMSSGILDNLWLCLEAFNDPERSDAAFRKRMKEGRAHPSPGEDVAPDLMTPWPMYDCMSYPPDSNDDDEYAPIKEHHYFYMWYGARPVTPDEAEKQLEVVRAIRAEFAGRLKAFDKRARKDRKVWKKKFLPQERRGRNLLRYWLSPKQWKQYRRTGRFNVFAQSGEWYNVGGYAGIEHRRRLTKPGDWDLRPNESVNVDVFQDEPAAYQVDWTYCLHGSHIGLCQADVLLMQKLIIETNEEEFLRVANRRPGYDHPRYDPNNPERPTPEDGRLMDMLVEVGTPKCFDTYKELKIHSKTINVYAELSSDIRNLTSSENSFQDYVEKALVRFNEFTENLPDPESEDFKDVRAGFITFMKLLGKQGYFVGNDDLKDDSNFSAHVCTGIGEEYEEQEEEAIAQNA